MTRAEFAFPTRILFGAGCVDELDEELGRLGAVRPLVVTDPNLLTTSAFRQAIAAAPDRHRLFSAIRSNPTEEDVEAATRSFLDNACDAVVGLGGGSALDVAKLLRLRARHQDWSLTQPVPTGETGTLAPFIAIPTTAGTGSEVGRSSVITMGGQKRVIFHPALLARLVILDPELTVDLPPKLTAATGADALTHCIESYTAPAFHPLCDGIALEAIRLIREALPRAVMEPSNLDARGKMQVAALMGGIAFQKDLGAAHSLAHPLSAICGMHHGLANALVLPAVMSFNAMRKPRLYVRIGEALGLTQPSDAHTIAAVRALLEEIGLKPGLRNQGVTESQISVLAEQALADGCHQTNPVPVTRDDLAELYRAAL